ncbi:chloramphenicol acetyltransferase CAT [Anaerotruncus massiliensis (ex Liu et al. 2021)]|uniref:Chloramphenicol acetyltransferase CAT n=2 Tax=Anaerotruncus TaxID=244127 RepID=A0A498CZC4_9FIRM|nr:MULTISPECIES: CatA-like O-acetyltransferase [Anaerotruncus]MBC3939187.1 chloramphenicol acetyltransferase CAT [Anaerotruncus massiliensis (ex Togo et al. 2019)]RLL09759.1 chloramphenicol acetyltransferase CAT [Anaerotruncus massiliensis (ex Liu et al. 2021)]
MFHPIELDRWERKDTFQNFMDLDCSYSVTQDLCVTPFHAHVRARGLRFYPAFSWAVLYAVNRHREFRMGLDGEGRPGYYDEIHAEYTVLDRRTGNMDSLNTAYRAAFSEFHAAMSADLERFERDGTRTVSRENSVLLSCVPWFTYTGLSFHMKSNLSFLRPMFVWGRYRRQGEELLMPFTIQAHHAATDGYHCHLLFADLERVLREPENYLK